MYKLAMRVKKLRPTAIVPEYQSAGAAAFDLHADIPAPFHLNPGQQVKIPTGIAFEVPDGHVLKVYSRSGQTSHRVTLGNSVGIIDSDYRNEVFVVLTMSPISEHSLLIEPGMRIAQGILELAPQIALLEVDELSPTARGTGGFGSTGA